jgi:phosphatidylserine/phosphatidylglycerophosphate/cardiolipin synthase-like enzyme
MHCRDIARGFALALVVLVGASCGSSQAGRDETPVTPLGPWSPGMSLRRTFESFPPTGDDSTALRLLRSNSDAWIERWRMLAGAERTIDLSYFILHQDAFGMAFLGHLLERAQHGVRVRLLLDAQGTKMSWSPVGNDLIDELLATGNAEIRTYRPLHRRALEAFLTLTPSAAIASEHDKIIVVDGRESLTGGRNIGAEYFAERTAKPDAFSDADLAVRSAATSRVLTRAFEVEFTSRRAVAEWGEVANVESREAELLGAYRVMDAWLRGVPAASDDPATARWQDEIAPHASLRGALRRRARPDTVEAEARILDSQARYDSPNDPITLGLARLVQAATRSILIESPYLVLSKDAVALLTAASRRGVEITVVTNSPVSSDNALSQAFFLEQWPELLARVPTMRLFVRGEPSTLHGKSTVFDGQLATVGTYNLDPTSRRMNSELVVVVWSERFARDVARGPRRLIASGAPAVYEYRIRRDAAGAPIRDDDGRPVVERGPEQHTSPSQRKTLRALWTMLRAADDLPGVSPIL